MPNPFTTTLLIAAVALAILGFAAGVIVALTLALVLEGYRFYVIGEATATEQDEEA